MSIEKGIFDRFFNGYLLGKRQLWKPMKYVNPVPYRHNKWLESIIYPRNKFEQVYSSLLESSLPTLQYFMWNPLTSSARQQGWTIQEKLFNSYFRNKNVQFHAMGQSLHPWGYIERQRADAFYRRVETMLPGCALPEWAQHSKRAPNFDFESVAKTFESYRSVYEEATPSPHYNTPNYFALQHLGNQRWFMGYWAQRLFFNEKPRGNLGPTNVGQVTKEDLALMDNWYGSDRNNINERLKLMSESERERWNSQAERWTNNIHRHFPEFANIKCEPTNHKYIEPSYERNMDDIRDSIFASKCMSLFESNTFSQQEIQSLYEYFIGGEDGEHNLFVVSEEDGYHHGTELYQKFIKEFNLPDIFKIQRVSARTPDQTWLDRLDNNWNINFYTVDSYRKLFTKLISKFNPADYSTTVSSREQEVRNLVSEEVYNALFRKQIQSQFSVQGELGDGQSVVLAVLKKDENAIDSLFKLQDDTRNAFPIANRGVRNEFLRKIRGYLKTRPFDPAL